MSLIPRKENVTDILTKALPCIAHKQIVGEMELDWRRKVA
jgi:hypothetical protein